MRSPPKTCFLFNSKGSNLLEASLLGPGFLICLMSVLILPYLWLSQVWMDHCLYEALICVASESSKSQCENDLKSKLKSWIRWGNLESLRIHLNHNEVFGKLTWKFTNQWKLQEDIILHLRDLYEK